MSESPRRNRTSSNPYRTVSASERRARRRARQGSERDVASPSAPASSGAALPQDVINELLHNPTKVVTEDQLRSEYSYVLADLRSMALLAFGLVVLLVVLATLLPR